MDYVNNLLSKNKLNNHINFINGLPIAHPSESPPEISPLEDQSQSFDNPLQDFMKSLSAARTHTAKKAIHAQIAPPLTSQHIFEEFCTQFAHSAVPEKAFTLFDARQFLEHFMFYTMFPDPFQLTSQASTALQHMETYYETTHQKEGFQELILSVKRSLLFDLMAKASFATVVQENAQVRKLCREVLENIQEKAAAGPSIHGHPRSLIIEEDIQALTLLKKSPNSKIRHQALSIDQQVNDKFEKANQKLQHYQPLFQKLEQVPSFSPKQVSLIVEAKKALLDIELGIGRDFALAILQQDKRIHSFNRAGLNLLIHIDQVRSEEIDLAILEAIKQDHEKALFHPRTAIEGGGPIGLLMAITQYQAGADVSLFEKRSTKYERTQIVRLDPKWIAMLKFYLGESYYKLFVDPSHEGILRSDGFVEIATRDLENALHYRLSQLISLVDDKRERNNSIPALERLAAHEALSLIEPEEAGGKFRLVVDYLQENDPWHIGKRIKQEKREIDFLICAGGKNSSLSKNLLPSSTPVTETQYYGVCSWLSNDFQAQNPEEMNFFQDFRGMLQIDHSFLSQWQNKVNQRLQNLTEVEKLKLSSLFQPSIEQLRQRGIEQPFVQTRTFENKGLIYIGMELPSELEVLMKQWAEELKKDNQLTPQQQKAYLLSVQCAWFDVVGEKYHLEAGLKMDTKFASTFPVDQNRLTPKGAFSRIERGSSQLLVTAAGDAFASPHFMRYSGLTGGRENILVLQDYMRKRTSGKKEDKKWLAEMIKKGEEIADFVIERGRAFLKFKSDEQIRHKRIEQMANLLEAASKGAKANFALNPSKQKGTYELVHANKRYLVSAKEGYLKLKKAGHHQAKHYQSFLQLKLELGLF